VNLVVIVICALAFEWLLAALARAAGSGASADARPAAHAIARRMAAYALLLWEVLRLQQVATVTPDLLVFAALACIAGFLVIRRTRPLTGREATAFGAVLGAGYLAKAVMLPVGLAALAVFAVLAWRRRRVVAPRDLVRACVTYVLIATPLIAVQTRTQGHLTFGETGRLNYRWYVSHAGEPRAQAEPIARTAQRTERDPAQVSLTSVPGAVLYAGAVRGSFPYGFDPSRFERRDGARVALASQRRVLALNLYWYWVVAGTLTLLVLLPIALAALDRLKPLEAVWPALIPALALLGLYLLTHVEGRLCGPAIVTLLATLLYAAPTATRRAIRAAQVGAVAAMVLVALLRTLLMPSLATPGDPPDGQGRIARAAAARGLRAGEAIAVVGSPYGLYWAHLAGVRLVAVVPPPDAQHPLDPNGLERLTAESCARGTAVSAVVWRTSDRAVPGGVMPLDGGWMLWRPRAARGALPRNPAGPTTGYC
jgi:4-amino-4-deoxy-L-arabinose transferase-like glycosyltransferase